jgi:uncharacterized membrane protein
MEQRKLPNATGVLVLGILSILTCCCYGIISIILGAVGMYLAKKDIALYAENPELYSNYGNVKTGRILCIIGIVLGAIYLLMMVWAIMTFGFDGLQNPELMQERMRELMGQ